MRITKQEAKFIATEYVKNNNLQYQWSVKRGLYASLGYSEKSNDECWIIENNTGCLGGINTRVYVSTESGSVIDVSQFGGK